MPLPPKKFPAGSQYESCFISEWSFINLAFKFLPSRDHKMGPLGQTTTFFHFCRAPMPSMQISDFPIYSFTNDLLPSSLYDLVFMKSPNCTP